MAHINSAPTNTTTLQSPPPILLAEPLPPSRGAVLLKRESGQLVDLSNTIGTAQLARDGTQLHIRQVDGQIIVIEGFFGGPANEFFILMPSGPLTTQSQFLAAVQIDAALELGSFQEDAPSPAQSKTDKPTEESQQHLETASLPNLNQTPRLAELSSTTSHNHLAENKQSVLEDTPFALSKTSNPESIAVPQFSPADLYVQPNSTVSRANDLPILTVEEASFRTSTDISVSDSLAIDFGVDGTNSRALLFTLDAAGRPLGRSGDPLDITSGGARVLFQSEFGPQGQHILKGLKGDGTLVFKVTLDPTSTNGTYTYQQFAQLDHSAGTSDLLLSFRFIAKDADGDSLISYLDLRVTNDPMPSEWNLSATISEAGLTGGSDGDPSSTSTTGNLPIGSQQGPVALTWDDPTPSPGFSFVQEGQTLLILQAGQIVLTVSLNASTGTYSVTQHNAIINAGNGDAVFNLNFSATNNQAQSAIGTLIVTSIDDTPKAFPLNQIVFDESQLSDEAELSFSSDYLPHNTGADGANISWQLPKDPDGLIYIIEGQLLSVKQGDTLILTATFTGDKGAYTVKQHNPLQHTNGLDQEEIKLHYVITDGDGDTAQGHISVSIKDDSPTVGAPIELALSDDVFTQTDQSNTSAEDSLGLTGVLPVSAGVDGVQVSWTEAPLPTGFSWDLSGDKITLLQGTTAIFSATLNSASGAYFVTQHAPLDHSQSVDQFQLQYIATDTDGDAATGTLHISISDSVPVASSAPENISLSETDLFEARMNGDASISQSGTLNIQWGADVGSTKALIFSSSMSGTPAPFTVNGAQVFYSLSGIGNELVAKTQDGTLVFKVTLDPGNTGSYKVEFFTPIDHATISEISMAFDIVATDGDGDTLPLSFSFGVSDGKSIAVADQFTGKEDTPLVLDLLGNDILNREGYSVHIILAPAKGHLAQNADNTFNYAGHPNANGSDSFSYYIQDADGERSETVTVSIELSPENDAPIFSGVGQNTPLHLTVEDNGPQDIFTANASDADGDRLHFFLQGPDAAHFNIDVQTGKVSWKDEVSYDVPTDQDGDNIYNVTIVARDPSGAEASQDYQIQVTEGHNMPTSPPTVYLHTREAGSYQVSWDFGSDNYTSNISDDIRSEAWKESGDDGLATVSNDGSSDIYIDEATGELVLTDRSSASANGDDNLASLSKTFDLTGAQSAQLSLSYTADFSSSAASKLFYIEIMMAEGSVQRIVEISSTDNHSQSKTISLDLSNHISSATTIRLVAPGELTSADTLRISDLTVSIEQPAPWEEQHLDATYQIDGEDLAVAKSAKIDGLQEPITGLTVKLFNAQDGDVLNYTAIDGLNGELQDSDNGVFTLNFSGNLNASSYQNLINSLTFSTNSDSLEARSLSVVLHTETGSSSPSITTIQMLSKADGEIGSDKNPVDGTSADDTLRGTEGDDSINGYEGNDHLYAGEGQDTLTGGVGSDIYFFEQLDGAADHIADFQLNVGDENDRDLINLSMLFETHCDDNFTYVQTYIDQYIRILKAEDGSYILQADFDRYKDTYDWETVTTFNAQNADVTGATLSFRTDDIMPYDTELPIENAFPVT
ncbi:DUF5801 repeats-in-toxin domain-containing protein [Pseudovibrio brasiliensis]|uniref:Cadherin-like domain-containing protein n=1 Tax=Pseudovibrio brasiliensis TaxID=1898042 RepID=A0ABX8AUU5_9HYPH|nr:Ig-like domain-containing protein [Pseudovibrio brasiliensis]QUS58823.1 cadherin-like domain-containing protein [Pseudovibrio brasiliensis]